MKCIYYKEFSFKNTSIMKDPLSQVESALYILDYYVVRLLQIYHTLTHIIFKIIDMEVITQVH